MTKLFPGLATFVMAAALLPAAPQSTAQTTIDRAWAILQQGVTDKSPCKRANAVHALRLLPHNPRIRLHTAPHSDDASPLLW